MRLIRRDSLKATPWKNGGGETREIASFPPGSQLTDFEWRLSTATVAQDGAFSIFDGVDRRLYLLEGAGLTIHLGTGGDHHLRKGDHVDFSGDAAVHGRLNNGPVVDFNIMVRRDKQRAHVEELSVAGSATLDIPWNTAAIFIQYGQLTVAHAASALLAGAFDTIMLDAGHAPVISVEGDAGLILIGFDPL